MIGAALPEPDAEFYLRYVESCRRLGVEPVPRERARELVGEWNELIATARAPTDRPAH